MLTTGVPAASDSIRLIGVPSLSDVSATTSLAKQTSAMSRRNPVHTRRSPSTCASVDACSDARSSPSPTTRKYVLSCPRTNVATRRNRSTRLIGTRRAIRVTTEAYVGILRLARVSSRRALRSDAVTRKREKSKPQRMISNCSGGATPRRTRSSLTCSDTATRRSVRRARNLSIARNTLAAGAEK